MSIPLTINGAVFEYPVDFDENWGVDATGWAQAVTSGMLQMAGGSFPLTADVNFGPNFGLLSKYFETRSANPATTGTVRLSSADAGIAFRNFANSGNNILTTDTSDNLTYNGSTITGGVNAGTQYQLAYYATTGNTVSGLTLITANRALASDANGLPVASTTTATELGYVNGVTSAIQPQLDAKVVSVSGTANQITSTGGTTPVLAIANPLTLPGAMTAGGNIAMGANKIAGLANGTVATDAAAFGQVPVITPWTAYTPTLTSFGTTSNVSFFWKQIDDTIWVRGTFQAGTLPGSPDATISLPGGNTINYAKTPNPTGSTSYLGVVNPIRAANLTANSSPNVIFADGSSTTTVFLAIQGTGAGGVFQKAVGAQLSDNTSFFTCDFAFPI